MIVALFALSAVGGVTTATGAPDRCKAKKRAPEPAPNIRSAMPAKSGIESAALLAPALAAAITGEGDPSAAVAGATTAPQNGQVVVVEASKTWPSMHRTKWGIPNPLL
jgi:hypothetical protein